MIRHVLGSMRIYQWTKNLVLFAGLIFTLKFNDVVYVRDAVLGFFLFSLAVSGMYILNDILDVDRDRLHAAAEHEPVGEPPQVGNDEEDRHGEEERRVQLAREVVPEMERHDVA